MTDERSPQTRQQQLIERFLDENGDLADALDLFGMSDSDYGASLAEMLEPPTTAATSTGVAA